MVIGAPRSGTAWASNWLTTEKTLCMHEVLFTHAPEDLDKVPCDRTLGVADTGLMLFPEWVAAHPAKKVILHREPRHIMASLRRAGLEDAWQDWPRLLRSLPGLHVKWDVLFKDPAKITRHLFDSEPDMVRHALLAKLNVQADFEKIDPDPAVTRRLIERMRMDER